MSDSDCSPTEEVAPPGLVITSPNLIVCEGESDRQFLKKLIADGNLGTFQLEIAKTKKDDSGSGGNTKFKTFLEGLSGPVAGADNLKNIILVSDNDKNPDQNFKKLKKQVEQAGGFKAPSGPLKRAKKRNGPSLYILMIPWKGKTGTLEHLILEAMLDTYTDEKTCMESYHECLGLTPKSENKKAKIQLQCLITTLSKDDPYCGASYMWRSKNGFGSLLKHKAFNRIARFLGKF